ncbi:hypothetical protein Pint_01329 [Pistacia integerrima]|uniref:Uncharacterized protein n=1 Tax=Pistacia integerrima TaxID=434235 RepID=A0ACC0ZK14_9ROSI|nr:hypothetical protein Pint_01329 [Pistacia integerrima]
MRMALGWLVQGCNPEIHWCSIFWSWFTATEQRRVSIMGWINKCNDLLFHPSHPEWTRNYIWEHFECGAVYHLKWEYWTGTSWQHAETGAAGI